MSGAAQDEIAGARGAEPVWPGWLVATAICIRFYSRLPVPRLPGEADIHALPDFRLVPRAVPLAGLAIALPAALVVAGAGLAGLHPMLVAALGVTGLVIITGAFHEDGLGDSADGLFGGHTPERRLEIMKDSRVGSFGAVAISLSLLLRVTALGSIAGAAGGLAAAAVLLVAAMASRAGGVWLLASEVPARHGGASAAVGRPTLATAWIALGLSAATGLGLTLLATLPPGGLLLAFALAALATAGLARLARRLIGGQTGDIVGAVQQVAEIAVYLGFALALGGARP
jgi:adenosylcobinamide-GDP ribazoletransferase